MDNNVIVRDGGGPVRVLVEQDVRWAAGRRVIAGSSNWVPAGSTGVPAEWSRTLLGARPGARLDARSAARRGEPAHRRGRRGPSRPASLRAPRAARLAATAPAARARWSAWARPSSASAAAADIGAFSFDGARPGRRPPPRRCRLPRRRAARHALDVVEAIGALLAATLATAAAVWRRGRPNP